MFIQTLLLFDIPENELAAFLTSETCILYQILQERRLSRYKSLPAAVKAGITVLYVRALCENEEAKVHFFLSVSFETPTTNSRPVKRNPVSYGGQRQRKRAAVKE